MLHANTVGVGVQQGAPEMAESRSLGEAIRLRRLERGMSQEELAEQIGPDVRQSDVSRLERGKILFPRMERLNQIASALGISIGTLLIEAGWFTDEESTRIEQTGHGERGHDSAIVIADDEPVSLEAIAAILQDGGYTATTAYDLTSLLDVIEHSSPGMIIVDIALPGLHPESLIEQMAQRSPQPVLVFMGTGFPDAVIEGPYLEKPLDSRQLFAFISSVERRPATPLNSSNGNARANHS